jgi:hypothetical protein
VAGPIQAAGAYAATGPLMLVRCRRNDGERPDRIALAFKRPPATNDFVIDFVQVRIDCSATTARPCAAPAEVCASYPLPQKSAGLFWRPQIESTGKFRQGGIRPASARIQGARPCPRQCCTRRRCALATDRRTFVLSPRDRRWPTYSFSARARARRFQRVCGASGFCSRLFLACLFRCSAQRAVKRIRGTPRMHG